VLTTHSNPDCDALGSELALAEHLQNLGKQVTILNSDATPTTYRFLDPTRKLQRYSSKKHNTLINETEVIIVLDASGSWSRVGQVGQALKQAGAVKLCIDHHPDPTDFVDVAVVDTHAAATGQLIYDLILQMGGSLSRIMAQALYAALLTDTGSFRFPKTSPQTHQITANLLAAGAVPLYIYNQIYEQNSLGLVRFKGRVLDSIQTAAKGRIAYYAITRALLKEYGVKNSEMDGFAGLGQQIGGVQVTIFCTEASGGRVKISLRSDGSVAINTIAQAYGGGGHVSAAGALVEGSTLDQITVELVEKVRALLPT